MPTLTTTLENPAAGLATFLLFAIPSVAFCFWRLVNAFEEISLSLAKIAAKAKDEARG
jgi:hypothetical protein